MCTFARLASISASLAFLFCCAQTPAATIIVTTTADTLDAGDGQTSLREAILAANGDNDTSAITFDETAFAAPRKTITLTNGPLPHLRLWRDREHHGPGRRRGRERQQRQPRL